jgi:hypothetical protein
MLIMKILGVQFKIDNNDFSEGYFKKHIEHFYKKTEPGDIIIFPEDIGLVSAFIGIKSRDIPTAMQEIYVNKKEIVDKFVRNGNDFTKSLFLSLQDHFKNEFYNLFSDLSKKYAVYTFTCNNMGEGENIYNTCFVFDPRGNEIFRQRKVYLTNMEESLSIDRGDLQDVRTLEINGIKFGIAISLDAFYPDYLYLIRDMDIFIQPDANPGKWNSYIENGRWQPEEWMDSTYFVAQRFPKVRYAINPMMVGNLLGIEFEGQSSIAKKAEPSDTHLGYIGNIPTTGFLEVMSIEKFNAKEFHERKYVENISLDYPEGVLEVEI